MSAYLRSWPSVYSAICFVVPVWLRDVATALQAGTVRIAGRYQAIPVLLLLSTVLVLADYFARGGDAFGHSWSRTSASAGSVQACDRDRCRVRRPVPTQLGGGLPGPEPTVSGAILGDGSGQGGHTMPAEWSQDGHRAHRSASLDGPAVPGRGTVGAR